MVDPHVSELAAEGVGVSKPPDKHVMERLAFIRYMYDLGVEQATKPEPHSWMAILTFHDSVELFLGLAASHLDADPRKDTTFVTYWKLIDDKMENRRLPYSGKMGKLNDARVAFKHHGNPPSVATIEQCRRDVDLFFDVAAPIVFGVDFMSINMIDVVPHVETVLLLRQAEQLAEEGDHRNALGILAFALDALVVYYSSDLRSSDRPFPGIGTPLQGGRVGNSSVDQVRPLGLTQRAVSDLQMGMLVMALGIDYPSYVRFLYSSPDYSTLKRGESKLLVKITSRKGHVYTREEYIWGRGVVIDAALRVAAAGRLTQGRTSTEDSQFQVHFV